MAERPNPNSIALCTLISLVLDPEESTLSLNDETMLYLLECVRNPPAFSRLIQANKAILHPLSAASDSIDGLIDLFLSFESCLSEKILDPNSELGIFVRKVLLGFNQLSFESVTRLYEALKEALNGLERSSNWPMSPEQISDLLRVQCLHLDQGKPVPDDFDIDLLTAEEPNLPAVHFYKFISALKRSDRVSALDSLHQYFDFALMQSIKQRKVLLQYAPLLLAKVHQHFGLESSSAIEEAIHVAQQSGDKACLSYAMSLIDTKRCASHSTVTSLAAGAHLAQNTWSSLQLATTEKMTTLDRPTHLSDQIQDILGKSTLVGAGLWDKHGFHGLSCIAAEIGMLCFGKYMTRDAKSMVVENLAKSLLQGPITGGGHNDHVGGSYGIALQHMIDMKASSFGMNLLLHEWAVRRGDYGHANVLIHNLVSQLTRQTPKEIEIEVWAQQAFLLSHEGETSKAISKLQQAIDEAKDQQKASLLIRLAVVHLDSNQTAFCGAIRCIVECLALCEEQGGALKSVQLHACALSILAQIHYRMGRVEKAIPLVKGIIPMLLQNADVWFVANAHLTLAKCCLEKNSLKAAQTHLQHGRNYSLQCQDAKLLQEIFYLQARIHDSLDEINLREKAAKQFCEISRHLALSRLPAATLNSNLDTMVTRPLPVEL